MTAATMARDYPTHSSREWRGPNLPKPAWIAIMVLGFIAFWPIGLAILGYMWWTGRIGGCSSRSDWKGFKSKIRRGPSSGNMAFDEYREETMRRLEEERREFAMFMERLKRAKDQSEFDTFMAERNGADTTYRADSGPSQDGPSPEGKPSPA